MESILGYGIRVTEFIAKEDGFNRMVTYFFVSFWFFLSLEVICKREGNSFGF
jgi:hypothetical protein